MVFGLNVMPLLVLLIFFSSFFVVIVGYPRLCPECSSDLLQDYLCSTYAHHQGGQRYETRPFFFVCFLARLFLKIKFLLPWSRCQLRVCTHSAVLVLIDVLCF